MILDANGSPVHDPFRFILDIVIDAEVIDAQLHDPTGRRR